MDTSQRRFGASTGSRRRQHRATDHPTLIRRVAPPRAPNRDSRPGTPDRDTAPAGATARPAARLQALRRLQAARRAATAQCRQLQRLVEERERERDLALADTAELRLRSARLAARCYMLEAERRDREAAPPGALEAAGQQLSDRLSSAEHQQVALEQEMVRLRTAMEAWTRPAMPAAAAANSGSPTMPWYRRLWFALIGEDVRAAEWAASQHPS